MPIGSLNAEVTLNADQLETILRHAFNQGFNARHLTSDYQINDSNKLNIMRGSWEESDVMRNLDEIITNLNASIQIKKCGG